MRKPFPKRASRQPDLITPPPSEHKKPNLGDMEELLQDLHALKLVHNKVIANARHIGFLVTTNYLSDGTVNDFTITKKV